MRTLSKALASFVTFIYLLLRATFACALLSPFTVPIPARILFVPGFMGQENCLPLCPLTVPSGCTSMQVLGTGLGSGYRSRLPFRGFHQESSTEQLTMSHASWASCLSHLMPSENLESPGSGPALFPSELMPLLSAQVHNRSRDKGSTKEENSVWELKSPGPQLLYFRTSASVPSAPCILREVGERKGTRLVGNMGCFPDGGFPGKRLPPTQGSIRHTLHVWH